MRFPVQTGTTILLLGAALAGARRIPPESLQNLIASILGTTKVEKEAKVSRAVPPPLVDGPRTPLLDDRNHVLDHFYRSLHDTEEGAPAAVTRVLHYGDSPTTADLITGDVRRTLQARFGNAGHGFILPAKPWEWYQHSGAQSEGKGWLIRPATQYPRNDGLFGLGGVSFTGSSASSKFKFDGAGYTHFELWFEHQPNGGDVTFTAGEDTALVETAGDGGPGFATFETQAPVKALELSVARGHVRIFGLTAERAGPGLVYDTLGLNGASVTVLSRSFNEAHWTAELQHRNPDLVIINYGTNEADSADFIHTVYEKELREVIRRIRAALPETSILVMSPMDRGYRDSADQVATMPTIPEIVTIQRRVAKATGCGFFDTFHAMGGPGTIAQWYAQQPRLVAADFIHPNPAGGRIVADAFTRELLKGYERSTSRAAQPSPGSPQKVEQ